MAVPPVPPPIEQLGPRPFSFFPSILNIEHNEWIYRQATWSEVLVENAKTHAEVWVPRRFIGVNVIYNKFWTVFTDYVGANINPFCSQVLAGLPREDDSMKGKVLRFRGRHAL